MRISEVFYLGKTQYELDFVDIDPSVDLPLFIDPYFLAQRNDSWSIDSSRTIRNFFQHLVTLLSSGGIERASLIFSHLGEPNETCMGLSKGEPKGRGIGSGNTEKIFNSLLESRAVQTGVVEDLEDCRIFVDGVDKDKVSDMTTNIIRRHLIEYTIRQCLLWDMPLHSGVPSGFFWNRQSREWNNEYTRRLIIDNKKILLVSKAIVSYRLSYTPQRYHQHFVLNYLQNEHLRLNTVLVKRKFRKDGAERLYVTKKDVEAYEAPLTKEFLRKFTESHPDVFQDFRQKTINTLKPLGNDDLYASELPELSEIVDYLIDRLSEIPPGPRLATRYHRLVIGILELLFYPTLISPEIEREIHEGRKRIDITFDNAANHGFFYRLHKVYNIPAQFIFVECKNYSEDPANPELDQLSGRFSLHRGKFGLLLCRTIDDMPLFLKRCEDTYCDDRGIIFPVVDDDLIDLLRKMEEKTDIYIEEFLAGRFRSIALR